jgi:hypothetical protein
MKYLMLVIGDENMTLPPDQPTDPQPWIDEAGSRRLVGNRLQPSSDATTVRVRNGQTLIADGPFAETKEQIGGFDVLECADLDEAIELASKHPVAQFGTLEIRPFWSS